MKLVHITAAKGRLLSISHERLDYCDEDGTEAFIDLALCYELLKGHFRGEEKYIGFRNAARKTPFATLNDGEEVRFVFDSYEAIYTELLNPLRELGWVTLDLD